MGAKTRVLPGFLDRAIADAAPAGATVVDLMTGSGVVAAHCARRYRVIASDVQEYAAAIARSLIEQSAETVAALREMPDALAVLEPAFRGELAALEELFAPALAREAALLERLDASPTDPAARNAYRTFLEAPESFYGDEARSLLSPASLEARARDPSVRPCCLVTAIYAHVYFGLRQSIVLDALRAAILDLPALSRGERAVRDHCLSALLHVASRSTSGTSHFAQPRHLRKDSELLAVARRRRIDVLAELAAASKELLSFVLSHPYRDGNRVLRADYRSWIDPATGAFDFGEPVDLIYLDPPYTADHYSRFYHALEVIARYDYPPLERDARGQALRGRYPSIETRHQSSFCSKLSVEEAFRQAILASARAGAKLIISYSSPTGLLLKEYAKEAGSGDPVERFAALCREGYRSVEVRRLPLLHSGQGDKNRTIDELLLICE